MNAKEVAKLLANRVNQEHYILDLMTKLYNKGVKDGINKGIEVTENVWKNVDSNLNCTNCHKKLSDIDLQFGKKSNPKLCVTCFTANG